MRYFNLIKLSVILILSFFTLNANTVLANDAPINLQGGGAHALTGHLTVAMDSEIVKIILHQKSYTVDAIFNFSNTGNTVELNVGFPKNGAGWLDDRFTHTSDFIKFETWVDGKQVNFVEKPNMSSIEGEYTLPDLIKHIKRTDKPEKLNVTAKDYRWMVKEKVKFHSNKTTTTRVRYEAPYQNFGGECKGGLTYIYGTGSHWNGNIDKSTFIVDGTGIPKEDRPKDMRFVNEKDRRKIKCSTSKEGVLQCVIKNYKPETPDAAVVVGIGCIDFEKSK